MSIREKFILPRPQGVILCTSGTHPANPYKGMRIHETDTGYELTYQGPNFGWTPPWNTAWGLQIFTSSTATQTAIGHALLTFAAVTWNAYGNRNYEIAFHGEFLKDATAAQVIVAICSGLVAGTETQRKRPNYAAAERNATDVTEQFTTLGSSAIVSTSRCVDVHSVTGNVDLAVENGTPNWFGVWDTGPSGGSS